MFILARFSTVLGGVYCLTNPAMVVHNSNDKTELTNKKTRSKACFKVRPKN